MLNPSLLDRVLLALGYTAFIWLPVLVLGGIVVAIATARAGRDPAGRRAGFGGWLLIYAAAQIVALAIAVVSAFGADGPSAPGKGPAANAMLETVIDATAIAFLLATTLLMLLRSRWTPTFNLVQSIAIWGGLVWRMREVEPAHQSWAIAMLAISVIVNLGWIAYLARSARARNTFTR